MKKWSTPVTIFWFRRDLRLHDNHGLFEALNRPAPVLPIFIFDPEILDQLPSKKDGRVSFIYQTLQDIDKKLKNRGSSLLILYRKPLEAFREILLQYDVVEVIANHDYEPYARRRDKEVTEFLGTKNIPVTTYKDQVIFERSEVVKKDETPYTVFTPYSRAWKIKYREIHSKVFPSEELLDNLVKIQVDFPDLKITGFQNVKFKVAPLDLSQEKISNYHKTRNRLDWEGTTHSGVYLRFGLVSIRALVEVGWRLNEHWLNELIWREFFMMILYHYPEVVHSSFKKKYDHLQWRNNEKEFEQWCKGETGYPVVDAAMRQLNNTGWMHNRARMIVAGFLTKHLLIDWRWGEAYFADKLMDYELSSNNGNWQWAAGCGCDAAPYFRIFNPYTQAKKFDPEGIYVKKWIPNYKPDYLYPMVDHEFARKRALGTYNKV